MPVVQNSEKFIYTEMFLEMVTVTCCKCGVLFGMPSRLQKHFQDSGEGFHCPNGHGQVYKESTEARLRKELQKEKEEKERQLRCRERAENMYRKSEIERKKSAYSSQEF